MSRAQLQKRLGKVEATLAELLPPAQPASLPAWIGCVTFEELDLLEMLYRREAECTDAITQADVARVLAIECQATARMLAGEPQP